MSKPQATSSNDLNSEELARYSRHILLEEIGVPGQEKLKSSNVLIIGAGGLGSPAALYLAAAGVGNLGIADFDKVELHNLQRQIIHGIDDLDTLKTESAKNTLSQINPNVAVKLHAEGVTVENAVKLFSQYDVIVDGTDNFSTRYLNNDAAYFSKTPLVYGSIFKFEGQVSVFKNDGSGPCYRCLFPEPPPPGTVPNCGEAGVLGALCGIVGSMQALEAIKLITGIGEPLNGSLIVLDTLSSQFRKLKLKQDPSCPLCGNKPTIQEIKSDLYQDSCSAEFEEPDLPEAEIPWEVDVIEARKLNESRKAVILDVREPFEFGICSIEGSIQKPMNTIPNELENLPREEQILVICHSGVRSMQVTNFLRRQGFDKATNIAGGIDAWAMQIDPNMQRY